MQRVGRLDKLVQVAGIQLAVPVLEVAQERFGNAEAVALQSALVVL